MTSLIIEARVASYADIYLCKGDDIFRTLERIESKKPYYTTLIENKLLHYIKYIKTFLTMNSFKKN